jgi:hypothetical protein
VLLLDVHEGAKGIMLHQGFYRVTVASDAAQIVRYCSGCQYFTRQIHTLTQELQIIPITWSFTMWGFDLLGPFRKAPRGLTVTPTFYKNKISCK